MILSMSEILKQVSEASTKKERIEILYKHNHPALQELLALVFKPEITWLLPEGPMAYTPCIDQHDQKGMLYNQIRKMYLYVETPTWKYSMDQDKREKLFLQFIESIDPQDAEMMMMVKDKKMYKGITRKLVMEAFPGLLGEEEVVKNV